MRTEPACSQGLQVLQQRRLVGIRQSGAKVVAQVAVAAQACVELGARLLCRSWRGFLAEAWQNGTGEGAEQDCEPDQCLRDVFFLCWPDQRSAPAGDQFSRHPVLLLAQHLAQPGQYRFAFPDLPGLTRGRRSQRRAEHLLTDVVA